MSLIKCEPGDTISLSYNATDRATSLYPKAFIYDTSGNEITTVNLAHVANGLYQGAYTPDGAYKILTVHYIPYSDAGRTTEADYESAEDKIYCNKDYIAPGFGSTTALISVEDKEDIVKKILEKIEGKLDFTQIMDELSKKSEFDPLKDKVKTDIKIPNTSFRDITDKLDELKKLASQKINIPDYTEKLNKIGKEILKNLKDATTKEVGGLKANLADVSTLITAIKMPEFDAKPIIEAIDGSIAANNNNSRQGANLVAKIGEAITDLKNTSASKQSETQTKLLSEIKTLGKEVPRLEKMLEALNTEDFNRINLILQELKKINQFLKVLSSMILNNKMNQEETDFSDLFELLNRNSTKR